MTTRFASLQKLTLLSHIKVGKIDELQWKVTQIQQKKKIFSAFFENIAGYL